MHRSIKLFIAGLTLCSLASVARAQQETDKEVPLEVVRTFKALTDAVNWVALSPDESLIALGSRSSDTVFIYEVETGKERTRIKLDHNTIYDAFAFAFSADGKSLALREIFPNGIMRVFDTSNGKLIREFQFGRVGATAHSYGSAFSRDGKLFAICDVRGKKGVETWNVETGKPVRGLEHESPNSCAFSPDGKLLATQDTYGTVRVWDVATGKKLQELARDNKPRQESLMTLLTFSPDGKQLAVGGSFIDDQAILVWDVTSGKKVASLNVLTDRGAGPFSALVFTPHGKWLAVSHNGPSKGLAFLDIATGQERGALKPDQESRLEPFNEKSVMFTRSGKYMTGSMASNVNLYALRKGTAPTEAPFVVPAKEMEIKPKD